MYARVTTGHIPPDRTDEAIRFLQDDVRQKLVRDPGFKGSMFLIDRQSGKAMTIGLRESEAFRSTTAAWAATTEELGSRLESRTEGEVVVAVTPER